METRKRVKLFVAGVILGMSMFFIGGLREPVHGPDREPTTALEPWLQKTMCNYPAVDCTSVGKVVTSAATDQGLG